MKDVYIEEKIKMRRFNFYVKLITFSVDATNKQTAIDLIHAIDTFMTIDIQYLGCWNGHNGVDISQTKYYVKLSNETYMNKLLEEHAGC